LRTRPPVGGDARRKAAADDLSRRLLLVACRAPLALASVLSGAARSPRPVERTKRSLYPARPSELDDDAGDSRPDCRTDTGPRGARLGRGARRTGGDERRLGRGGGRESL